MQSVTLIKYKILISNNTNNTKYLKRENGRIINTFRIYLVALHIGLNIISYEIKCIIITANIYINSYFYKYN